MRLFVTVGAQLPFERLVIAVDTWAQKNESIEIFAQIGKSKYHPTHIKYTDFLPPSEYKKHIVKSSCIIGHAGMGTIITAMEHTKPLLMMPRNAALKECTNNHQMETAKRFVSFELLDAAYNTQELFEKINSMLEMSETQKINTEESVVSPVLIEAIQNIIKCI